PAIEAVRAALGDRAQRASERCLDQAIALARRAPAGEEELAPGAPQLVLVHRPIPGHALMHWKAILRTADGGEEQFIESLRAIGVEQHWPARDCARDRDAVGGDVVRRAGARSRNRFERSGCGGPARAVDGDDLSAAGRRIEAEAIAAESRRLRL